MQTKFFKIKYKNIVAIILLVMSSLNMQSQESEAKSKNKLKIGGAVRFNWVSEFYESNMKPTDNYATFDTWRINVDATIKDIDLSFEYRWYPTFGSNFIHHGYFGYAFSDKLYMKLGVFQVPFGITKYASHSWWFQAPYYVGLEDDYDMGIGFAYKASDKINLSLAYFRQAEPEGPSYNGTVTFGNAGPGRYSYDITPGYGGIYNPTTQKIDTVSASIRELNQGNLYLQYFPTKPLEVGVSVQLGGIYNSVLDKAEMSYALAGHLTIKNKKNSLKAEGVYYNYNSKADNGTKLDVLQMGAYGFPYDVATESVIYSIGYAYTMFVDFGPISSIEAHLDYSYVDKMHKSFTDTQHLIPGFLVTAGSVYTYIDFAFGKNQPWLTNTFGKGLGIGDPDAEWNLRFNINMGYYF